MTNEQARKVLDELQGVRPEMLNGEAKKLFEAIMLIADERDEYKDEVIKKDNRIKQLENMNKFQSKDIKETVDYTFELNKEIELKDKIIDLMSDEIESLHSSLIGEFGEWTTKYCQGGEETTIEEIKQYFENEAIKD